MRLKDATGAQKVFHLTKLGLLAVAALHSTQLLHVIAFLLTPGRAVTIQAVFHLTKLRLLAVRASGLRKLTPEIAAFTALRRLDVSRSRDLEVQEDIPWSSMTSLKSLDLSECRHLRVCAACQQQPRLPVHQM